MADNSLVPSMKPVGIGGCPSEGRHESDASDVSSVTKVWQSGSLTVKRGADEAELVTEKQSETTFPSLSNAAVTNAFDDCTEPASGEVLQVLNLVRVATDDLETLQQDDGVDESVIDAALRKKKKAEALLEKVGLLPSSIGGSLPKVDQGEPMFPNQYGSESSSMPDLLSESQTDMRLETVACIPIEELALLKAEEDRMLQQLRIAEDEINFLRSQEAVDPTVLQAAIRKKKKMDLLYANAAARALRARSKLGEHSTCHNPSSTKIHEADAEAQEAINEEEKRMEPNTRPSEYMQGSHASATIDGHGNTPELLRHTTPSRVQGQAMRPSGEEISSTVQISPHQLKLSVALCETEEDTLSRLIVECEQEIEGLESADWREGEAFNLARQRLATLDRRLKQAQELTKHARALRAVDSIEPASSMGKSIIVLEIMPLNDDIDVEALGEAVVRLQSEGIDRWIMAPRIIPFGFGSQKLHVAVILTQMSPDELCDLITDNFPGDIQSIEILSAAAYQTS